jgi:hypothetical protein
MRRGARGEQHHPDAYRSHLTGWPAQSWLRWYWQHNKNPAGLPEPFQIGQIRRGRSVPSDNTRASVRFPRMQTRVLPH